MYGTYSVIHSHSALFITAGFLVALFPLTMIVIVFNLRGVNDYLVHVFSIDWDSKPYRYDSSMAGFDFATRVGLIFFSAAPAIFTNQPRLYEKVHPHQLFFHQDGSLINKVLEGSLVNVGDPMIMTFYLNAALLFIGFAHFAKAGMKEFAAHTKDICQVRNWMYERLTAIVDRYWWILGLSVTAIYVAGELASSSPAFLQLNPGLSPTDYWDIVAYVVGGAYLVGFYYMALRLMTNMTVPELRRSYEEELQTKVRGRLNVVRAIVTLVVLGLLIQMAYSFIHSHAALFVAAGTLQALMPLVVLAWLLNSKAVNLFLIRFFSQAGVLGWYTLIRSKAEENFIIRLFISGFLLLFVFMFSHKPRLYEALHPHQLYFRQDGSLWRKILEGSLVNVGDPIMLAFLTNAALLMGRLYRYMKNAARNLEEISFPGDEVVKIADDLNTFMDRSWWKIGLGVTIYFIAGEAASAFPFFLKINPGLSRMDPFDMLAYFIGGLFYVSAYYGLLKLFRRLDANRGPSPTKNPHD